MNKISEKKINEIIEDLNNYKTLDNEKHKAGYYYQMYQNVVSSDHSDELKVSLLKPIITVRKRNLRKRKLKLMIELLLMLLEMKKV